MPIELKMPALSPTMEEGTLAKWLVKEGDEVKSGDILAEIETDKATMEFEAVDEGTIAKILVAEGTDEVKVGTVIALIAGEGEDSPSPAGASAGGVEARDASSRAITPKAERLSAPRQARGSRPRKPAPTPSSPRRRAIRRRRKCRKAPKPSARPSARRFATPWRRRCAPTTGCS